MQLMSAVHRPCSVPHASGLYDNKIIVPFGAILKQFPQSPGCQCPVSGKVAGGCKSMIVLSQTPERGKDPLISKNATIVL